MTSTDAPPIVEVRPAPFETAVVNLPPGTTVRVVREGGRPADWRDVANDGEPMPFPFVAEFPAPELNTAIVVYHGELARIRSGRHSRDRNVREDAAKLIRDGGVAYVAHELRDWYGKPVWWAVSVRTENDR